LPVFAMPLLAGGAVSAGVAATGASFRAGGSIAAGAGNSAWAFAIEGWTTVSVFGPSGFADGDESGAAACDSFSRSLPRYQQCRLVAWSIL
jgi:hypothetical protein